MESVTLAASAIVNAPPILKVVLVVVILLARLAAPVVEKPPGAVITPVAALVNSPELVTATAPPEAAVKLLFTAYATPCNVAEPTATVFENVVVPVAALVWLNKPDMAIGLLKYMASDLVMVSVVRPVASAEVPEPYMAARLTKPVPELIINVSAEPPVVPVVVPVMVIGPTPTEP